MKKAFTAFLGAGIIFFSACKKEILDKEDPTQDDGPVAEVPIDIPFTNGFNYNTTKDVKLNISLLTNDNRPISGVVVSIYLADASNEPVFKGVTDKSGQIHGRVTVAASAKSLIIDPAYVGLIRNAEATIAADNTVTATIGGKEGFSGSIMAENISFNTSPADAKTLTYKTSGYVTTGLLATTFAYPGTYSATTAFVNNATYPKALGRPVYLEATGDILDASLLSYINASLPENQPLTTTHPAYLNSTAVSTLNVTAKTDVYVTFVSEGADQKNTLGYYTYPTGTPPNVGASLLPVLGGIDKVTWVLPNASAFGSGGGLKQGDKIKIGNFAAGTTIAFVMIKNGWSGTDVTAANAKFYSNDSYNPGAKKQSILLYDDVHKKFVSSFEDMDRSVAGSDNDFNDLVIYSTSSVAGAISTTGVATIDRGGDTDGDGVQDAQDKFPTDPERAFVSYYPSESSFGTIAFEDQWPIKGDYDMNDLVVGFRYTYEVNASNKVVNIKASFKVLAAGTGYKNGFGVELPLQASAVRSVSGQKLIANYVSMAANGVEAGQTRAVIIPFDNHYAAFPELSKPTNINTYNGIKRIESSEIAVNVTLVNPVDMSSVPVSAFNPFLIGQQERGREVHLMGYRPTEKADSRLFDTGDDATVPGNSKFYQSLEGKPFAIMFNNSFSYPTERREINKAYLMYNSWATSGGSNYADWYSKIDNTYRFTNYVYTEK